MIKTEMKWYLPSEQQPEPDTLVLVCSKDCDIDQAIFDEENKEWYTADGFPVIFDVWMWSEISCPDGNDWTENMDALEDRDVKGCSEQVIEIHVRGGVAYEPEDSELPSGIRIKIVDHDNESRA